MNRRLYLRDFRSVGSLNFDGATNRLSDFPFFFGNNFEYDTTDKFTFSFWIYPRSVSTRQALFNRWDWVSVTEYKGYYLDLRSDGKLEFVFLPNLSQTIKVESSIALTVNKWQHVCVTHDGLNTSSAKPKIYIESVDVSTLYNYVGTPIGSVLTGNTPWQFGARENGPTGSSLSFFYNGLLDELTAWSGEFSSDDVKEIWNGGTPMDPQLHSRCSVLDSWFPFIDDLIDLSGLHWFQNYAGIDGGLNGYNNFALLGVSFNNDDNSVDVPG